MVTTDESRELVNVTVPDGQGKNQTVAMWLREAVGAGDDNNDSDDDDGENGGGTDGDDGGIEKPGNATVSVGSSNSGHVSTTQSGQTS